MRKGILTIMGILLLNCLTLAQVLTDFESGNGGWARNPYRGEGIVTATVVADPTPRGEGNVLEIAYDGTAAGTTGSGQIQADSYDFKNADIITFWVYVPSGFPDGAEIKPIGQDGWCWCDASNQTYKGADIPKDKWYPLNFNIREIALANPGSFSPYASGNYLAKLQLAVYTAGAATEDERKWSGKIYLDNVTAVGSSPYVDTDFEAGLNGWGNTTDKGTGITAITIKADPTSRAKGNILELAWDGAQAGTGLGGQIQKGNYDFKSSDVIAYWIYLPKDFPDSYQIKPVGQDGWCWCDAANKTYNGSDIPKETWFPIYLNIREISIANPGSFSPYASGNYLAKLQLRISSANATGADVNWKGVILMDDVSSLAPSVPIKWVVSTWDNKVKMLDGWFNDSGLGAAIDSIYRTTLDDANVLGASFNFSTDKKGNFSKPGISIHDDSTATDATDLSIDVFLPSDIPSGKITWLVGSGSNLVAAETAFSKIGTGGWKKVNFGNIAGITDKKAALKVTIGVELDAASSYKGTVYFDNFTVWGIPEPVNKFQSPEMVASVGEFDALTGVKYPMIQIDWVDLNLETESYRIYQSENPITDVHADGVQRIGSAIAHGNQTAGFRPFTTDGGAKTYYYAITAIQVEASGDTTETPLRSVSASGPMAFASTSSTYKISYVKDFANSFSIADGDSTSFIPYAQYQIKPESAGGDRGPKWTPQSNDFQYRAIMVMDDQYLYIHCDAWDDDLNPKTQYGWQGDCVEFYMGFDDMRALKARHSVADLAKSDSDPTKTDWRFGVDNLGVLNVGGNPGSKGGVDFGYSPSLSNEGWSFNIRVALDSVMAGRKAKITNGMTMPLRIDGNDIDPDAPKNEGGRGMVLQTGMVNVSLPDNWTRPDAWGTMELIGYKTDAVDDAASNMPHQYALYNNYPNPFNPSTTIKYDLPKETNVKLKVYDILGKEVTTLVSSKQKAGTYSVRFDASNLANGVYFFRLDAGDFSKTQKMILLK
jgi:hypothetical protein